MQTQSTGLTVTKRKLNLRKDQAKRRPKKRFLRKRLPKRMMSLSSILSPMPKVIALPLPVIPKRKTAFKQTL